MNILYCRVITLTISLFLFFSLVVAEDSPGNPDLTLSLKSLDLTLAEKSWLKDHPTLKIAGKKTFPPFYYLDTKGEFKGISADYMDLIMAHLGLTPIVEKELDWPEVLESAQKGKIDLIPCVAKTLDRETYLNFSTPYLSIPLVILTRNNTPYIGDLEDLQGKTVAVMAKTSTIDWLRRDRIDYVHLPVKSPLEGLKAVSLGKADACIENLAAATYLIQRHGLSNVKVAAPTPYGNHTLHIGIRKDLVELHSLINKTFEAISPEQHRALRHKWFSIQYEHLVNKTRVLLWILGVCAVSLGLIGLVLFWNRRLQREVRERKKAEEALGESEQRMSTLMDNLPGIAYQCQKDIHWTMNYLSDGCRELTGYEPFELLNNQTCSFGDLIVPEDRQHVLDEIQTALKQGRPFSLEYRIQDKKNTLKWVWEKGRGLPDKENHPEILEGFIQDITEQKRAEEINKALFAISNAVNTTQNLDHLFRSIHLSLGKIIDVTNFFIALVDIHKRTLHFPYHVDTVDDDFSTLTDFDTRDSLTGFAVDQHRPVLLKKNELKQRAAQKGIWGPVPLIWMGAPLIVREKIIGVVAVQSYVNETLYTEQDLPVLSTISDQMAIAIDRKRANDALKESEKKYRHLFAQAPAGIYEIDFRKGRFLNVNEIMCTYTGFSEKEFLTMNPLDLLTEESKSLYTERIEKLLNGENLSNTAEYTLIKKEGQRIWVILNNDYVYQDGKLTGSRVVVHDITELKKAQEDKIQAQKFAGEQKKLALVGQIAGKMAHDFNNILGIIMGNIELTLLDCQDPQIRKTLELIFKQTLRGKNLTRNLVAFAKDQEPKQEFFSINEKIQLVLSLLKKDLEGIHLIREYASGLGDLLADPGMIEHALVNLIQNAIHAVSKVENPHIILRTYGLDTLICFEVEDNGCGIPQEYLETIYDPSFTLKGTRDLTCSYTPGIKGTGYGMANVKKYIEQHKGEISVESKLGSGTRFTIRLPAIKKKLTREEKAEIRKEIACTEKYLLLVEDEPAISDILFRVLTQEPCHHRVDIADNGQKAMELFDQTPYDLISLDYMLPGNFTGMDLYRYFRKTNKTIPILFMSGNFEFLESIKALKRKDPFVEHLSKPCQNKAYVSCINQLLTKVLA